MLGEPMRKTIAMTLTMGSVLVGLVPSAGLAKAAPLLQECSSATNGGTLQNGVCVLPGAVARGAHDYFAYVIASNGESSDTFAIVSGSLPNGLTMPSHYGYANTLIS